MNGEFVMVSKSFIERLPELSGGAVKVYLALLSHSKKSEGVVWPSMSRLGEMCGFSRCQTVRLIEEIIEKGLVSKNGSVGRCNLYQICALPVSDLIPTCIKSEHDQYQKCDTNQSKEPESLTRIKNKNPQPPKGDEISFSPLMDDLSERGNKDEGPTVAPVSSPAERGIAPEKVSDYDASISKPLCPRQPFPPVRTPAPLDHESQTLLQQLHSIPRFAEAWESWERHLSEKKTKPTPTARLRQLKDLLAWETERPGSAILALETAIRCNWNGLFKQEKHEQPLKPHQRNLQGSQLQHVSEPHPDRVKWLEENRPKPREVGKMRPGGF